MFANFVRAVAIYWLVQNFGFSTAYVNFHATSLTNPLYCVLVEYPLPVETSFVDSQLANSAEGNLLNWKKWNTCIAVAMVSLFMNASFIRKKLSLMQNFPSNLRWNWELHLFIIAEECHNDSDIKFMTPSKKWLAKYLPHDSSWPHLLCRIFGLFDGRLKSMSVIRVTFVMNLS